MKIAKEINTYCPYCNAHTLHVVKMVSKTKQRGLGKATRRHERAIKGYVGSVELKIHPKKLGKKQKVILTCKKCNKQIEKTLGKRTKKKIEIKR
jgi:large subunit ribosomal protein L44e